MERGRVADHELPAAWTLAVKARESLSDFAVGETREILILVLRHARSMVALFAHSLDHRFDRVCHRRFLRTMSARDVREAASVMRAGMWCVAGLRPCMGGVGFFRQ